jgi:hypothetical protein
MVVVLYWKIERYVFVFVLIVNVKIGCAGREK